MKGRHNRPRSKRITRLIKKYKYTGQSQFDGINEINAAITKAYQEYNKFKRSAQSSR
jgi:plasmid replication initiation protein